VCHTARSMLTCLKTSWGAEISDGTTLHNPPLRYAMGPFKYSGYIGMLLAFDANIFRSLAAPCVQNNHRRSLRAMRQNPRLDDTVTPAAKPGCSIPHWYSFLRPSAVLYWSLEEPHDDVAICHCITPSPHPIFQYANPPTHDLEFLR
jgi:hypothetical protein